MPEPRAKSAMRGTNAKTPDGILDPCSGSGIGMTYEHHAIHEGMAYQADGVVTLGAGGVLAFEVRIPAKIEMHMRDVGIWATASELQVRVRENPTIATPGTTPLDVVNRNRSPEHMERKPLCGIFANPVGITGGKILSHPCMGGGGVGVVAASDVKRGEREWVLGGHPEAKVYTIELENEDNVARRVSYGFFWCEVEQGD